MPAQGRHGGGGNDAFVAKLTPDGQELVYSTFLGGSDVDFGERIAVDDDGNAYVAGTTYSRNFPTTGRAVQRRFGGGDRDGFVAKLSSDGTLVYSTLLGGDRTDRATAIAVDGAGNVYVAGSTNSRNFAPPRTGSPREDWDVLVAKLDPSGSRLVYTLRFGGTEGEEPERGDYGGEAGTGIQVDSHGTAYVAGYTDSMDFPVRDGAQPKFGGVSDGFVVRIDATGSELLGGTYLGGAGSDTISGMALDPLGNVYVTGTTEAVDIPSGPVIHGGGTTFDFPVHNAVQPKGKATIRSAFVTQLGAGLTEIGYSTYLSGSGVDSGYDIAVDSGGNAYITGETQSRDFPLASPLRKELGDTRRGYDPDAFVTKLSPGGASLVFSTFLGAGGGDYGDGIAVDSSGDIYVTGTTGYGDHADFPTVRALQPDRGSFTSTAFLSKISV